MRISIFVSVIFLILFIIRTPFLLLNELNSILTSHHHWQMEMVEVGPDLLHVPNSAMSQKTKDKHFQWMTRNVSLIALFNKDTEMLSFYTDRNKLNYHLDEVKYDKGAEWKGIHFRKTNPFFHAITNMTVKSYILLSRHGFFEKEFNIHFIKERNHWFTRVEKKLDFPEFRGEIACYLNVEHALFIRIKTNLFHMTTAMIMVYIAALLAAYYAARDIFIPLNTALKKLIHVNKNNFNERISYNSKNNPYLNKLTHEMNIILERAEHAVLSQQQSAREITHQIRTPLTSIQQSVDYFRMFGFENEKKRQERLDIIGTQVDRIVSMTEKIITLSKFEQIQTENEKQYNLSNRLTHYIARKKTDNEKITFEQNIQDYIITLIPYEHILQILDSLIENAVKYSFEPKEIYIGLCLKGPSLQLSVRNRGVEISEDEIDKIFEHSYRAKAVQKNYNGTGLGLAVVKRFVDLHNGQIDVLSKNNMTTFVVTLPNKI